MTTSPYFRPRSHEPARPADMTAADPALPVVVVGAGPVGMAAALGLARRGVPVTVLEAATQVSFGSRAICISRHSLEVSQGEALEGALWAGLRSLQERADLFRRLARGARSRAQRLPTLRQREAALLVLGEEADAGERP